MKRSSQVGLLISAFALSSGFTVGIANGQATQAKAVIEKQDPVYRMQEHIESPYSVSIGSWEEKRQLFEQAVIDLQNDRCGDAIKLDHCGFK
jgi:hypothetical protein